MSFPRPSALSNTKGVYKSYEDPSLTNNIKDKDIWFDLTNKLIKFRLNNAWITFDYSYA
ncbi:MAG: hypothetical protein RR851_15125 [Clostridium sp.]